MEQSMQNVKKAAHSFFSMFLILLILKIFMEFSFARCVSLFSVRVRSLFPPSASFLILLPLKRSKKQKPSKNRRFSSILTGFPLLIGAW